MTSAPLSPPPSPQTPPSPDAPEGADSADNAASLPETRKPADCDSAADASVAGGLGEDAWEEAVLELELAAAEDVDAAAEDANNSDAAAEETDRKSVV